MMHAMGRVTLAVFLLSLSMAKADELRTARELKELAPAKMAQGMPARILGVVTSIRGSEFPEFTLQDETGGVVAHLDGPVGERVKVGQRVEIEGTTDEKPPSPRLDVRKLTVHEMVGLPAPIQVNPADLKDGSMDCQYVEFPGVIRKVVTEENIPPIRLILDFGPPDQRLSVWVSHFNEQHEKRLQPDAEVRVRGVCNSWRRLNHQPFTTFVTVANPDGIEVVKEAPVLDALAERPLEDLLSLPVSDFMAHREKAGGVVTLSWPDGEVVIQTKDGKALRTIALSPDSRPRLGEGVNAAGFPWRTEGRLVLESADYESLGAGDLIEPESITPRKLLSEVNRVDREGILLRLSGRFLRSVREEGKWVLWFGDGKDRQFRAMLPAGEELPETLREGTEVTLTGVCRMLFSERAKRFGRYPDGFILHLQDAGALSIQGGSWWTQRRLAMLVGGISVVLVAAVAWALALRRRAKQRSEMLVKEIRARNDAELLAAERMRLAADLHDTLSQSLSGAAMQLEVAGAMEESPEDMERHLGLARRLIDRSREDLRRTVWDLDPSALSGRDLADALRKVGREMSECAEVVVEEEGDLSALPERIRVHLFRAAQEALGNALRHGNPTKVLVRILVEPMKVRMTVEDNGKGFDLATVPGPDEGHFGLRSLRERFARLSGECEISSGSGGTMVRVAIPLEERRNE